MLTQTRAGSIPTILLLVIAFIQGLMLLAIYRALDTHYWPWQQPVYLYPLLSFVIVTPTLCLLGFVRGQIIHYVKWIGVFSFCLLAAATYTGWQLEPGDKIKGNLVGVVFVLTSLVASFKALMYIQQYSSGQPISYSALFRYSWRNFLVLGLSFLFTLIFWGILFLCGALFKVIGIDVIAKLIGHDWFYIPVLSLAHGFGILIFRNLANVIDTIAKILQVLMKFLLPALVLIAIAFLATLPFTGLQALWGTGQGSRLILWLQVLVLFFVNAVYQDESHILPYPRIVHRAIYCGIALLPIYSIIAFWGLYARVSQYGLSVERCWALLLWLLLFLFTAGYLWGIIRKRDQWVEQLSRVNISMGLIVLGLMLLVNSPMLDFRKVSLANQIQRFESGVTTMKTLDVDYISRHLARSGYLALQELKAKHEELHPEFAERIDNAMGQYGLTSKKAKPTVVAFSQSILQSPAGFQIPDGLVDSIYAREIDRSWHFNKMYLLQCDLDDDGEYEYVFIRGDEVWGHADMWRQADGKWTSQAMRYNLTWNKVDLSLALQEHAIEIVKPKWNHLKVGKMIFTLTDNE